MIQTNNYKTLIPQVINEIYSDCKDLGIVDDYIQPSVHTSDFELSEGWNLRVFEGKQGIYYNPFRNK